MLPAAPLSPHAEARPELHLIPDNLRREHCNDCGTLGRIACDVYLLADDGPVRVAGYAACIRCDPR